MVSEKSFTAAEWLFILGNLFCAIRIIGAPQIDRGQRVAIITFVILIAIGLSSWECLWVESRRAVALAADMPLNVEIASSGGGGGAATVPTNPKVSLPSAAPASTPGSSPGDSGKPKPAARPTGVSTFTRQQLDDLLNSNIYKIGVWRQHWLIEQGRAAQLEADATLPKISSKNRKEYLRQAEQIRKDPRRAAIEPSEMRSIVSTSNQLQKEVVANWLGVMDRDILPDPNYVRALFKKFESNSYSIQDIGDLDSYMRRIRERFEVSRSTD